MGKTLLELGKKTLTMVRKTFPPEQHEEVFMILIEECSNNLPYLKNADNKKIERFQSAALELSGGDINRLLDAVILAQKDRRKFLEAAGVKEPVLPCFSCAADAPDIDGPVHSYMDSSPGCWAVFGEVLAREYSDITYARYHRITVDAYALQHPGGPSRRSIQSVAVHLISLYLILENSVTMHEATRFIQKATRHKNMFFKLTPPENPGSLTIVDVWQAADGLEHGKVVKKWADCVWAAWKDHHHQIKVWSERIC